MSSGFLLHYAVGPLTAAPFEPRFSVTGHRHVRSRALAAGWLDSTLIGATHEDEVFFCGQLAEWGALARRMIDRGLPEEALRSPGHCVRAIYRAYGAPGLRLLDGLFAGAFIDGAKLVAFASKTPGPSLYYRVDAQTGSATVSTELKALPREQRRLRTFDDIMSRTDAAQAAATCLDGVARVRAGHCIDIDLAARPLAAAETAYYSTQRAISLTDEADCVRPLRGVLAQVVNGMAGHSAHCLVSGGLDSSIVAYHAQRRFDRLDLFTLGTPQRNEFDQACAFGASLGLPVERIVIDDSSFLTALPEVIALTEHCFSTFAEYLVPVHLAHLAIGSSADIMLSGYGSDVLFAGFAKPRDSLAHVAGLVESEYASTGWANEASQCLGGVLGLEIGYPFFDSRVVDLAFSIDPYLKHKNGVEKFVLREAYRGVLDDAVIARRKVGIHQGTGCEDHMSEQIALANAAEARRYKDALCYRILQAVLIDEVPAAEVDMAVLRAETALLAQGEATLEKALA